ncbi:hypothetical protein SZN_21131 [Streptomyces zinciresistens K42]|uniref:Uncharacterized protein n=1 Tax=Streptomyces zinciresistens K42 TaxID=700597 RepID=G2GFE2_9ACTN|nr:hypothetical protein SZN_21131 [Streptomyces zinciresistens K42]
MGADGFPALPLAGVALLPDPAQRYDLSLPGVTGTSRGR